ncbi:MAG: hypothetical protein IM674_13525 [Brevundimonas sp.]|nr:hypothetical protein [Brevundimonas sp.]
MAHLHDPPPVCPEAMEIEGEARQHGGLLPWLRKKVDQLEPGETLTYWIGSLGWDRRRVPGLAAAADFMLTVGVGSMAFAVSDTGYLGPRGERLGYLTQRRIGPDQYHYQFTKLAGVGGPLGTLDKPSPRGRTIYRTEREPAC